MKIHWICDSISFFFSISLNEDQTEAAQKLLSTIEVINETVGDAISDMFLVEVILQSNGWDVKEWYDTYVDLPNLQKKICVQDRNVITTTDAERKVVAPDGLQAEIDELVAKYPRGRSFVRPSGTEDIVRVYAEAASKEVSIHFNAQFEIKSKVFWFDFLLFFLSYSQDVDHLAAEVSQLVYRFAGGIGPEPQLQNHTANGLANWNWCFFFTILWTNLN